MQNFEKKLVIHIKITNMIDTLKNFPILFMTNNNSIYNNNIFKIEYI